MMVDLDLSTIVLAGIGLVMLVGVVYLLVAGVAHSQELDHLIETLPSEGDRIFWTEVVDGGQVLD